MTITYTLWIDLNRNGIQTSDEIITSDVLDMKWRLGMAEPYDTMAPPGWAEIRVDARSGAYTGANAAALMGCCLTIVISDGWSTRTHFVGFIDKIIPSTGSYSPRTALLIAHTRDAALEYHVPRTPVAPLSEAKALIRAALVKSGMPYRATNGYLVLDHPLGVVGTRVFDDVESFTGGTGLTTLAYGGAWDSHTPNARALIAQVVESERGRFFCGRDNTLYFYNRHVLLRSLLVTAVYEDDMTDLQVSSGQDVINEIEIQVVPRRVGTPNDVVWTLPTPLSLAPGETRCVHIPFHDEVTQLVGAQDITRYTLTATDSSGLTNVTGAVSSWLSDVTLTGATLSLHHPYSTTVLVTAITVYGTPLFKESPQITRMVDMPSVIQYGRRYRRFDLPALSTMEQADDIALYELNRRKTPDTRATHITLNTQTFPFQVLSVTLYDRITITEAQTLPTSDYMVCAEEHHVQEGGLHEVTWLLEPAEDSIFACVGHLLDGAHLVAY